ncbi:MAG: M20/M25/M40 family metallo-hydrolase, partial [Planctomycetota bacterium]
AGAINITPAESVAWVSLRPMPGIDGQPLVDEVRQQAESGGMEFEELAGGDPLWVDADADFIGEFCQLTGARPRTVCFGTDGGQFGELTRRIVCGPGDIAQAHTSDEWISHQQMQRGIDIYRQALERWSCG